MIVRSVSTAVIAVSLVLSAAGAASAQAAGINFGDMKSGVTTAGPETDKAAISAPTVEPG